MFDTNRCLRYTTITPTRGIDSTTTLNNLIPSGSHNTTLQFSSSDNNLILSSDIICISWNYIGSPSHNYSFCILLSSVDDTVQAGPPTIINGITSFNNRIYVCSITLNPVNTITISDPMNIA